MKCKCYGCTNESKDGLFIGVFCTPCFSAITKGAEHAKFGTSFIHGLVKSSAYYRAALQDLSDGNYPHAPRNGKCSHGMYHWESCENCIFDHIDRVLLSAPDCPQPSMTEQTNESP
jgi:hypothetical protein